MSSPDCFVRLSLLGSWPSPFAGLICICVCLCVRLALRLPVAVSLALSHLSVRVLYSFLAYQFFLGLQIEGVRGKVVDTLVACNAWRFAQCVCYVQCYIPPLSLELQRWTTRLPATHIMQGTSCKSWPHKYVMGSEL